MRGGSIGEFSILDFSPPVAAAALGQKVTDFFARQYFLDAESRIISPFEETKYHFLSFVSLFESRSRCFSIGNLDEKDFVSCRWDRILVRAGQTALGMENDLGVNRRHQRPPGHMAWGCTASNGKSQLIILPRKTALNATNFIQKVLVPHVAWLKSSFSPEQLKGSLWVQDGARCHTAATTEAWIRENMERNLGMVVIGKSRGEWPARSPDLNVLDWACWGPFKRRVQGYMGVPHINLLPGRMRRNWPVVITEEFVKKQMKKFRNRLQRVVDMDGGYIE